MITPQALNIFGLCLGMIGAAILFVWGPPQPSFSEGVSLGLEDASELPDGRTVAQHNEDVRKTKRRYDLMARLGLALIFAGFGFQLWGVVQST